MGVAQFQRLFKNRFLGLLLTLEVKVSTVRHGSGEIFYFGGGLPQIFFIPTSSKDEGQSRDSTRSPVLSLRSGRIADSDQGISETLGIPYSRQHAMYDRVKQGIIDYHIDKILRDGTICPINSPYASPVVLTLKKNDLPPDSPEAYSFAIDYRKLNGFTKYPRYPLPFNLFTDASGVGIGAVLQQNQKPVAFASRTLNKAERNYTVTERECLAVIWVLNKFKTYLGPLPVKVITDHAALTKLTNGKNLSSRMIRWTLKLSEFNIEWEHRPVVQNVVTDLLSRNPVDSIEGSQISCAALRALAINSREQFIREQREDPELGHIYRYLENPDDGSINAMVCEGWSQDFKLINGLLFYAKYFPTLGELRVYIPGSLRKDIMKEFHDLPLAGHLGKRKTYLKLRDTCYFPFMRKYIFEYVSTCDRCQKFNYKNALPAGRLMPIVSKYPNEIVTLDL
ncbi:retrovirus-related Pol polyprotein from transposon opus [Trichonephila clavipes]|nr:retrovirus-related Pol polyprotein from transposon opus [Trichonephila clavipes]